MNITTEQRDEAMRETLRHVRRVGDLVNAMAYELNSRAVHHDASKFSPEEFELFAESTPRLKGLTYGSPEYKASLETLRPAIEHHNANNTHHPEFYRCGVNDMTLLDLVEMLCDWKAATERHADGSLSRSLEINAKRFGIEPQLLRVLMNTADRNGWLYIGDAHA